MCCFIYSNSSRNITVEYIVCLANYFANKQPVEYDMLFHGKSSDSVLPPVYNWTQEKTVLSKAGKLLGKYSLNTNRFTF